MKKIMKVITIMMLMVMVLTGATPTVTEAKNTKKTSIVVTNKLTGQNIGEKTILIKGWKVPLQVKYGKTNVTQKAKYKASNKNITISKKGKITAKKVGTTTVTIKYKKKKKKFKVIVKSKVVQTTTEQSTTEAKVKKKTNATPEEVADYIESHKITTDPWTTCSHEWEAGLYISPDVEINPDNFYSLYETHFVLHEITCKKCGNIAVTKPVPYMEAKDYTSDDFAKVIDYYRDRIGWEGVAPKHKHKRVSGWIPPSGPGDCWFGDDRCAYCNTPMW